MFKFKQFSVDQSGCAMKINTDGVLLGALAKTSNAVTILDIGTGTGVIALMLGQRFIRSKIDAVEIDITAAETAKRNFAGSPFADRLSVYPADFGAFFKDHSEKKYDLIVSNPPFHINSLESPGAKKSLAKHTDEYFFEELIRSVAGHLTENGECWLILPLQTAQLVKVINTQHQLNIKQVISILSYPDSVPHREILVLTLDETKNPDEQFVIYARPKVYSEEYQNKLKDFFTIF
ncbi:methyltransferase [Mucilaginibacter sp.]|uniref:tRNA1(Val) (adenine(37)-N6)-methyltransferase n=1 Tax=Mucilaginibacter sp. TaxID=1882438 RepID=UPI00262FFA8F|nr:methyltransferase [Mucilaginibacter sp.]MDB4925976.1 methyltransferase protein [Mucilaginibacter sp.]